MALETRGMRARRIAREAAEWHTELLEPVSDEVRARFEAWRSADPEHRIAYGELEAFSTLSKQSSHRPERSSRPRRAATSRQPAWALAAIAAVLVAGLLLVGVRPSQPAFAAVINTAPFVRTFRLSDGSTMVLDVDTTVEVAVDGSREVRLRTGRARFMALDGPASPFRVTSPLGSVSSPRGQFDLALNSSGMTVVPLQGSVSVVAGSGGTGITTASPVAVLPDGGRIVRARVETDRLWPASRVSFDRTPLQTVVERANRLTRPPIRLGDNELGGIKVTAVLDIRDTRKLARKLAAALDLELNDRGEIILLTR